MQVLTWDELHELVNYDEYTGLFTWNVSRGPRSKNSVAGSLEDDGYYVIRIKNKLYKAHRLAWFYMHGIWPTLDIDHIDRDRSNNTFSNLREVSRSINNTNTIARNSLGVKGVYKNGSSYMARIQRNNKNIYLGTYKTMQEAELKIQEFIKNENINLG